MQWIMKKLSLWFPRYYWSFMVPLVVVHFWALLQCWAPQLVVKAVYFECANWKTNTKIDSVLLITQLQTDACYALQSNTWIALIVCDKCAGLVYLFWQITSSSATGAAARRVLLRRRPVPVRCVSLLWPISCSRIRNRNTSPKIR